MLPGITHRRLEPFGAEAELDLAGGLGEADKAELRRLYALDGLLLIRGLRLSMDEQLDLCSVFGPVLRGSRENYLVSNVHKAGLLGSRELLFHNDIPFVPEPYLGGSLHALDVADGVSATRFASGLRAYERLPGRLRERIEGLNALQVRERVEGRRNRLTDMQPGDLCTLHPVVRRRDDDGRPYLFVNQSMTASIVGLSEADSEALIEELLSYLYVEDGIHEHVWTTGDIVIWDNLAVQHARKALGAGVRTLQRVTIAKIAYWDQWPADLPTYEALHTFQEQPELAG
jgi:taurine dioxygenase